MEPTPIIQWLAPIASALVICAGQLAISARFKRSEERHEQERQATAEKRAAEAKWREEMERRIAELEAAIDAVLKGQTTQMRSDLLHKAHRYVDDLGCASTEEKDAFWAEYEDYMSICDANNIANHFIEQLAQRVMGLPNRDV